MFYHPDSNSVFEGEPDEDEKSIRPVRESERTLDDGESVGDAVKRIGDDIGWDGLSAFAEDHLGADETDETQGR